MADTHKVYITRQFQCSTTELFNWFIDPQLVTQWFGPKNFVTEHVEVDFKIGGAYRIILMNPDGHRFSIIGTYQEIDRPNKIVFSFGYQDHPNPPPSSIIKLAFEESEKGVSELVFVQEFETEPADMATRTEVWGIMLDTLATLVE